MTRILVAAAAVVAALILLGVVVGDGPVFGPVLVAALLLCAGPAVRVRRNLRRMAEHRALAARAVL